MELALLNALAACLAAIAVSVSVVVCIFRSF